MRLWGTTTAINSCVLEILQNIEKILQCKVHNIPPKSYATGVPSPDVS
jgi:hypothetical protein